MIIKLPTGQSARVRLHRSNNWTDVLVSVLGVQDLGDGTLEIELDLDAQPTSNEYPVSQSLESLRRDSGPRKRPSILATTADHPVIPPMGQRPGKPGSWQP